MPPGIPVGAEGEVIWLEKTGDGIGSTLDCYWRVRSDQPSTTHRRTSSCATPRSRPPCRRRRPASGTPSSRWSSPPTCHWHTPMQSVAAVRATEDGRELVFCPVGAYPDRPPKEGSQRIQIHTPMLVPPI